MAQETLTRKITSAPNVQVVLSSEGRPSFLQVPWTVIENLSEGELETLEIFSDPWWSSTLPKRLKKAQKDINSVLKGAVSLKQYRARIKS